MIDRIGNGNIYTSPYDRGGKKAARVEGDAPAFLLPGEENGGVIWDRSPKDDVLKSLNELFIHSYSVSMCPFYQIKNEYRLVVLDNQVELVYKKIKPVVIGDGQKTLKELLMSFNKHFFSDLDDSYNQVLANGEIYEYNWQFNLSKGASLSLEVSSDIKERLLKIVKKITDNVYLGFVTVDIVELNDGNFLVMEIR